LDGSVTPVGHLELHPFSPVIQCDRARVHTNSARQLRRIGCRGKRELVCRRNREKRPKQSLGQVAVIRADWIVDSDQIGAVLERPFDLNFMEAVRDSGLIDVRDQARTSEGSQHGTTSVDSLGLHLDVTPAQHLFTLAHQLCNRIPARPHELLQL